MLKIEKYFRIVTTLVFIMATLIVPILVVGGYTLLMVGFVVMIPALIFKYVYIFFKSLNFLLAFLILVGQLRTTKRAPLILASSLVLLATALTSVSSLAIMCFWPMYLTAFILVHSAVRATPYAEVAANHLRRSRKSRKNKAR